MRYNIILADPPWTYRDTASAGHRGASYKYSLMSHNDIAALPVKSIADNNCALFLWVTLPQLDKCWSIIENWGFQYKTVAFTWVKLNKKSPSLFMGMGRYTRSNAEVCLLATRGKLKRINAGIQSVVMSPYEYHSKKPDSVRDKIVDLFGDLPRIELFARQTCIGWDSIGNAINGQDIANDIIRISQEQR